MEENRLDNPLVSICMPAYNAEAYIYEAVNSILEQSYRNLELIIVNDGSTDRTGEIIEEIKDSRIKLIHTNNKGQCTAANHAFYKSTGDLIKFMDADDLISNDFIQLQVNCLKGREDAVASANWGRFYKNDLKTFQLSGDIIRSDCNPIDWLVTSMYNKQAMMQCGLWLIPRNILNSAGLWNENLSLINDFEFFIRVLLNSKKIRFTENAILYYRSGMENSLSKLKSRKGAESAYNSISLGTESMLKHENSIRVRKIAADCFQKFIYTFYPYHSQLTSNAEHRIKNLGGSNISFSAGGVTYFVASLIGWKLTCILKKRILKYE